MKRLDDILEFNKAFVSDRKYEEYATTKFPDKKMVILTCMDTRLVELLLRALNLRNGDVKIVRNAGAVITHPFGSIMRSILVAVYELQADEIFVIGHHDCGMANLQPDATIKKMISRGIAKETFETLEYSGINVREWMKGFDNVLESVNHSVEMIKNHPLLPENISVHGLVIDPNTGKLDLVKNGY